MATGSLVRRGVGGRQAGYLGCFIAEEVGFVRGTDPGVSPYDLAIEDDLCDVRKAERK